MVTEIDDDELPFARTARLRVPRLTRVSESRDSCEGYGRPTKGDSADEPGTDPDRDDSNTQTRDG